VGLLARQVNDHITELEFGGHQVSSIGAAMLRHNLVA